MSRTLLNAALLGITVTLALTLGAIALLFVAGGQCVGHGICDLGVAAIFGVLFGPVVCVVCVPIAASLLAATPAWRTRTNTFVLWSGVAFLVITGPIAIFWAISSAR